MQTRDSSTLRQLTEVGRKAKTREVLFKEAGRPPGGQTIMMLEEVEVTSQAKLMMSQTCWVSISVNEEERSGGGRDWMKLNSAF